MHRRETPGPLQIKCMHQMRIWYPAIARSLVIQMNELAGRSTRRDRTIAEEVATTASAEHPPSADSAAVAMPPPSGDSPSGGRSLPESPEL